MHHPLQTQANQWNRFYFVCDCDSCDLLGLALPVGRQRGLEPEEASDCVAVFFLRRALLVVFLPQSPSRSLTLERSPSISSSKAPQLFRPDYYLALS